MVLYLPSSKDFWWLSGKVVLFQSTSMNLFCEAFETTQENRVSKRSAFKESHLSNIFRSVRISRKWNHLPFPQIIFVEVTTFDLDKKNTSTKVLVYQLHSTPLTRQAILGSKNPN